MGDGYIDEVFYEPDNPQYVEKTRDLIKTVLDENKIDYSPDILDTLVNNSPSYFPEALKEGLSTIRKYFPEESIEAKLETEFKSKDTLVFNIKSNNYSLEEGQKILDEVDKNMIEKKIYKVYPSIVPILV